MTGGRDADPRSPLERAQARLAEAAEVLVVTGAGISADSGVPTFRGPEGLWRRYRPEELATPEAFARDPRLVWEWYGWRREKVAACRPNAAHYALARWARRRAGVRIVTQNVDGLHALAAAEEEATDVAAPLELHGSLFRVRCTSCGQRYAHRERIAADSLASLPACRSCGALLRPDVVWFGERLPAGVLEEAFALAGRAAACLVIGTSAIVQPAASLPVAAADAGAAVIEVNPEATPLTGLSRVCLRGGAAATVPRLLSAI